MKLTTIILFSILAVLAQLRAHAQDVSNYWDYSASVDGYSDFYDITDGDGFYDSCGGTVQYVARASLTDPNGNVYDGGDATVTVPTTSPASARSDTSSNLLSVSGDWTLSVSGYAYQCSCNSCWKIATFTPIVTYVGHGITYTNTVGWPRLGPECPQQPACTAGTTARCPVGVWRTGADSVCYDYIRNDWVIINGTCYGPLGPNNTFGVPADGPGPCR